MKINQLLKIIVLLASMQFASFSLADSSVNTDKPVFYVYLAGPEVFLPDPIKAGEIKKQRMLQLSQSSHWPFKLVGLYPMDNEIPNFKPNRETGVRIYEANLALMQKADFIAANMVRFRGPSMDVGTAFEMGYMRGLNKPVFAYYETKPFYGWQEQQGLYADRVKQYYQVDPKDAHKDFDGLTIEQFGMEDNLMMIGALNTGAGQVAANFDTVIKQIAQYILANALVPTSHKKVLVK